MSVLSFLLHPADRKGNKLTCFRIQALRAARFIGERPLWTRNKVHVHLGKTRSVKLLLATDDNAQSIGQVAHRFSTSIAGHFDTASKDIGSRTLESK